MTVSNRYVRQLEEQRSQDLATLAQLSRDLDAHLKGKQKVKTKVPAKYVGVTNAQGDSQYQTNLTRFGAKNLGRAFGVNMGLMELHNDTRAELESILGSGEALRKYVDIATETIIHLIAQAAARMSSAQSPQLKTGYDLYISAMRGQSGARNRGSITDALRVLNGGPVLFAGNVYRYLNPINRGYIEALEAINLAKIESRGYMIDYIANADAQNAVLSYLVKKAPSMDVLLPGAINGTDARSVRRAFGRNASKDIVNTFKYYQAAVDSELDQGTGMRLGDVEASLKAAQNALNNAASAMVDTGIAAEQARVFQNGFRAIAKNVGSLKAKDVDVEEIALHLADLFDLIGAYDNVGSVTLSANKIANAFAGSNPRLIAANLQRDTESILQSMPSASLALSSGLAQVDTAFLDAQDLIRPTDVDRVERVKPAFAAVKNNLSLAITSLCDAAAEVTTGVSLGISRPTLGAGAVRTPQATQQFRNLVLGQIDSIQTRFSNMLGNAAIDSTVFASAVNEIYTQILGVTSATVGGTTSALDVANAGLNVTSKDWDITNARFEQIADGRVPSLKSRSADGRTIEQVLISFVDREFANSSSRVSASVRRATRDAVLQSAKLFSDVLDGVRIQAENIGMVVRQNPMGGDMSGLAITGTVTASLVGTHALSALTNRFVSPKHGTVMSHVTDLAPSLAVIGTGVYLATAKDQKDLGYSLAGGAAGHLALRYLMKHVPALRFSENIGAKILQAPTNGLAHLLGDDTMGASGLTPANAQSHKKAIAEYVCSLVCENSKAALNYIAIQLWQSGLRVAGVACDSDGVKATFTVGAASKLTRDKIKDDAAACGQIGQICSALAQLKYACDQNCTFECKNGSVHAKCKLDAKQIEACKACAAKCIEECSKILGCKSAAALETTAVTAEQLKAKMDQLKTLNNAAGDAGAGAALALLNQIKDAIGEDQVKVLMEEGPEGISPENLPKVNALVDAALNAAARKNPMHMHGFILEPGYNMDVYSGEDQVSYLQPAPEMTAQSGFVQLEDAIARSEELGPHDKMMEGIGDLQDVAILRAAPSDARMIEATGAGVSLGQSRQNPTAELVALEVEGDNGLMSVAPQRQHSVPQGALNYAKIGHAPNVDVSPHGLFNRGVFDPNFGR